MQAKKVVEFSQDTTVERRQQFSKKSSILLETLMIIVEPYSISEHAESRNAERQPIENEHSEFLHEASQIPFHFEC